MSMQHFAKADAFDSWALIETTKEGHAELCKLLMGPAVAG